jgi:rifampicin phosphotransferase
VRPDVLDWGDAFAAGADVCGGKGFHLARLHRYGFRVPRGGVITVAAYDSVVPQVPSELLRALAPVPADHATGPATVAVLDRVRQALETVPLPPDVDEAIDALLDRFDLHGTPVAVRSSATAEDGAAASFAGIHRSFLNVRGREQISQAIRGCFASLWTPQALAYRRRMGFRDDQVRCAVVLCEMVRAQGQDEPRAAGVAFTFDPLTGRRDRIVVDATSGLGDAVVNGRVDPRRLVFHIVGSELALREREPGPSVLPLEREEELAHTLLRLHWALGDGQDPQDVEWAFDGRDIWILQARPATRIRRPYPEAIAALPRYWSTANIKEAVPGVVSMLSWSLIGTVVERVAFAGVIVTGYTLPPGVEIVRRFEGRGYFDLTLMQWVLYDALGVTPGQMVRAIGGHQPQISLPSERTYGLHGVRRAMARMKLMRRVWRIERDLAVAIERHHSLLSELKNLGLSQLTPRELMAALARLSAEHTSLDLAVGLANAAAGPWQLALEQALGWLFGDHARAMLGRLLAGTREVTSAEHGYAILHLARVALEDPIAQTWLESPAPASSWVELPESSPFRRAFAAFLEQYGHRAVYEAEALNPRWIEDPTYIVNEVRRGLAEPQRLSHHESAERRREDAEREVRRRSRWRAPLILFLVRRLRRAVAMREAAKSALAATMVPSRRIVLDIGRRLVEAGYLDAPADALHLCAADLRCYLEGWWDGRGARELTLDRARQRERWLAQDAPPDVIVEDPKGQVGPPIEVSVREGNVWTGIGAAPGRARGLARIVRHPNEAQHLRAGDVLVAPSTDPGWTPLFLRASAIVMETGGYLSHGAIVAREYGIPAVVNLPGVLREVRDGDSLVVDGDRGRVVREEQAAGERSLNSEFRIQNSERPPS